MTTTTMPIDLEAFKTSLASAAAAPAPAPQPERPATSRSNKFGGKCQECGEYVPAGGGMLTGSKATGWGVVHVLGSCPEVTEPEAPAEQDEIISDRQVALPVWPGRYTVETADGHRTFRVEGPDSTRKFQPTESIIGFLSGQDNKSDYTGFGFVKSVDRVVVWAKHRDNARLQRDLAQFLAEYAADSPDLIRVTQCARCGDELTVPQSVKQGFGPECVKKGLR